MEWTHWFGLSDHLVNAPGSSNSHYGKFHAHGVLERFRRTILPVSGVDAWKPVHKAVSVLAGNA